MTVQPQSATGPLALLACKLFACILLAIAPLAPAAAAPDTHSTQPAVFPGERWERWASPQDAGFSEEALARVREQLEDMDTTALIVVVGGKILFEYGDIERVSYIASVRKSILAMLYGIHHDRGEIDLDKTLAEMNINDHQALNDTELAATARHLITSTSGVYHPASNSGDDLASAPERGSKRPGEYYLYSNWDFNAAGTAFERQTGVNIFDALERELAVPLGMRDFDRARHRKGGNAQRSQHPSYHMHFSTRDMARLGLLTLRNGEWDGTRIYSQAWADEMTLAHITNSGLNPASRRRGRPWAGYGYMWWVWDGDHSTGPYKDAYTGSGFGGQYITILPALDMVVAHKTILENSQSVPASQYWRILDQIAQAHTPQEQTQDAEANEAEAHH
ncbi:MAG: serine hydrolase [Phycisphaerales bacterium]|nr:serine hydrolase [Phycisphaerales bacterium]